jgi:catechol 2,3-dioxygenase-like lactoylglutathione lyase family enzyme
MTNLANLRKQAKQYLRWHGDRYYPVAAEIRSALPRFRHLDDRQVLDARFTLADAQELVARQMRFDGWQALRSGAPIMAVEGRSLPPVPVLSATEAQLYVADVKASCDFYTSKLGFAVAFVYGEPPFYGMVKRDEARLCLRFVPHPVFAGDIRRREELLSVSITVDAASEIKQLFLSYKAAGVEFHQTLKKQPWAARTFIVVDPDGNLIQFAGPVD